MLQRKILINNKLGLHARASAKFVALAGHFSCQVDLFKGEQKVNGKSIMGVMTLAASKGTELELVTVGDDEQQAMQELITLVNNRFGEDE